MPVNGNCEHIVLIGEKIDVIKSAYDYPTDSSTLNCFEVKEDRAIILKVQLSEVKTKMMLLKNFEFKTDKKKLCDSSVTLIKF